MAWSLDKIKKLQEAGKIGGYTERVPAIRPKCDYDFIVGIDTGVNTGIAVIDLGKNALTEVKTVPIHAAMDIVARIALESKVLVKVEDARLRKWFGKSGKEKWQGAGSIKRDASMWEAFLKDNGIPHEMVAPKNNRTKQTAKQFRALTGWAGKTNNHGRDAAMLIIKFLR